MQVIDHKDQRYETLGDWFWDGFILKINSSDLGQWEYEFLIIFHELIEAILCAKHGISQEQVDRFDFAHLELDELGESPEAPYHKEHMIADAFERMMAIHLNVDWIEYEKKCNEVFGKS